MSDTVVARQFILLRALLRKPSVATLPAGAFCIAKLVARQIFCTQSKNVKK
ncbi:MAG: hypothetical protein GY738_13605 [Pseudoalteromonas sp.]|nr:hypothetical protein [Pseudoalteromonas sp.]